MKQQEVFKKIGVIINELNEQYEYLKTIDGPLNELELELFIANSHFLTDHVVILTKLNAQLLATPKPVITELPIIEEKPPVIAETLPVVEELPPLVEDKSPFIEEEPTVANDLPPLVEAKSPFVEAAAPEADDLPALIEEKNFEIVQPTPEPKYFEPFVQSVAHAVHDNYITGDEADNTHIPRIDLGRTDDGVSYSYTRNEEPETIRHELILDEDDWGDDDEAYETALVEEPIEKPIPVKEEIIEVPPAAAKSIVIEHIEELKPIIPQPQIVRETAKEEVLTINQRISAQLSGKASNITDQIGAQKIEDLKQAINLNDKLLYIKDLFNGYSLAYSEAIDILNRFANFEEADTFLNKNYVAKNQWEAKPDTTTKFYALLKRRYA